MILLMKSSFIRLYLPIFLVELYLLVTLAIFCFGPISYQIHEPFLFWAFILLYHVSMVLGYFIGVVSRQDRFRVSRLDFLPNTFFNVVLILSFFSNLIFYKNIMMSNTFVPYDLFTQILLGLQSPASVYAERMARLLEYSGSKFLNILYFFIAFSKPLLTVLIVLYWHKIKFLTKIISFAIVLFQILIGIASGTNKPIFDFCIFFSFSLLVFFVVNYFHYGKFGLVKRKLFVILSGLSFFVFIFFFGYFMSKRGGDFSYFATTSPLGDITTSLSVDGLESTFGFMIYALVWLSYYLVQGYYGFSLALTQKFTSTFGFGNSEFLMRQFEWVTGTDISQLTYQYKISDYWDRQAQWHSFYSHFANDVHFFGVAVIMLLLGIYLSKLWLSIIVDDNIYAKALMPLFVVLVIFIPANNQVFGYIESLSYFFIVSFLWVCSRPHRKVVS